MVVCATKGYISSCLALFQLHLTIPFMDSKYKFTKYFTLLRKRAEHFSMYSEMSNYGRKLADGRLLF